MYEKPSMVKQLISEQMLSTEISYHLPFPLTKRHDFGSPFIAVHSKVHEIRNKKRTMVYHDKRS